MTSAAPIDPATPITQLAPNHTDHTDQPDQPRFGRTFEDLAAQRPLRADAGLEP
jgi:hypothetical protein